MKPKFIVENSKAHNLPEKINAMEDGYRLHSVVYYGDDPDGISWFKIIFERIN